MLKTGGCIKDYALKAFLYLTFAFLFLVNNKTTSNLYFTNIQNASPAFLQSLFVFSSSAFFLADSLFSLLKKQDSAWFVGVSLEASEDPDELNLTTWDRY